MTDENFIVCVRVGISKRALVEGSIKKKCSICHNDIWVSPATLQSIELGLYKGEYACVNCMNIKLEEENKG